MRRLRILRITVLALAGMALHAQTPDCPKWDYAPVNTNAASGLRFSFDPATAVIVKISVTAKANGVTVKVTKDIKTARGFFAMETGSLDTLVIERIDIWMGAYSGTYDHPQAAKPYALVQVEEE
jgi:hypothetical protein